MRVIVFTTSCSAPIVCPEVAFSRAAITAAASELFAKFREVGFPPCAAGIFAGIGVDGQEQIGAFAIGNSRALLQGDELVLATGHDDFDTRHLAEQLLSSRSATSSTSSDSVTPELWAPGHAAVSRVDDDARDAETELASDRQATGDVLCRGPERSRRGPRGRRQGRAGRTMSAAASGISDFRYSHFGQDARRAGRASFHLLRDARSSGTGAGAAGVGAGAVVRCLSVVARPDARRTYPRSREPYWPPLRRSLRGTTAAAAGAALGTVAAVTGAAATDADFRAFATADAGAFFGTAATGGGRGATTRAAAMPVPASSGYSR